MELYNIVLAVGSVEDLNLLNKWRDASSGRILGGLLFPEYTIPGANTSTVEWPDLNSLRAEYQFCIHCQLGPPGAPYGSEPGLRAELGNPLLLEDVLVRNPKLRIYIATLDTLSWQKPKP